MEGHYYKMKGGLIITLSVLLAFASAQDGFDFARVCSGPQLTIEGLDYPKLSGVRLDIATAQGLKAPTSVKASEDPQELFTLVMLDPDAPSREKPTCRSWLHMLVTNIKNGDIAAGDTVTAFSPPSPPAGSGRHRYVFILIRQTAKINMGRINSRCGFAINTIPKKDRIEAATMFTTENK